MRILNSFNITQHSVALKLKAAQNYNIAPEKCHTGHVLLQGMLERPNAINQIDAATDESETNISVAVRSMRLANAMDKCTLQPGDVVIVMGHNHLDVCIPFYACLFNGYSMCAVDPSVLPDDLQAIFPYIVPKIVFCQKSCVEKVKVAFMANNLKGEIVTFDDKDTNLEDFIREHRGTEINFRPNEFNQAKIMAWLMLTSGTTGLPKVAKVPFETLTNSICCWWQQCTEKIEVLLGLGILQWVSTYFFFAAGPLQCYTRLQSSAPPDAQSLVRIIHKYKPTGTTCTVFLMRQFLVAAGNGCDLSSFKHIGIGGSSFEKPLLDKFRQICPATLHFVYGMTELVVPVFEFDENTPENSTGYPMDKYQYKLVDDDGSEIEKSFRTGELWVKGENFFKGYLNNPEQTEEMLTVDGWVKTGDMFYRDDQGFYFYVERKRLLIKHLGYMVSPSQMEEVIKRHPGVLEACVVGVPDPDCMERPVAAVSRRNGYKVDPEEIFTLLKNSLSKYNQLSGGLFFVDSFPVTPSQKINRKQVLELARTTPLILPK